MKKGKLLVNGNSGEIIIETDNEGCIYIYEAVLE